MWSLNFRVGRTFRRGAFYLMGCNALKNNRDCIVMEDIIVGYLTAFKVALTDIRPLVDELYVRINGLMRITGKRGCFNMIVNRNFAKFLSVIFACEVCSECLYHKYSKQNQF